MSSSVGHKRKRPDGEASSSAASGSKRSKKGAEKEAPAEKAASSRREQREKRDRAKMQPVRGDPLLSAGDLEDDEVKLVVFRAPDEFEWSSMDGKTVDAAVFAGLSSGATAVAEGGIRLHTADKSDAAQLRVLVPLDEGSEDDDDSSESDSSESESGSDNDAGGKKKRKAKKHKKEKGRECRMIAKPISSVVEVAPVLSAAPTKKKAASSSSPSSSFGLMRPVQLTRRAVVQQPLGSIDFVYRPIGGQTEDPMFGGLGSAGTVKAGTGVGASNSATAGAPPTTGKKDKKDKKEKKEKKEKK